MMSKLVTVVTALNFVHLGSDKRELSSTYLFAAVGNQVQVFIGEAEKPAVIKEVFPAEYRIHGFSDVVKNCMMIYGGRIVALVQVEFDIDDVRLKLQDRKEFDDWVWSVHWLSGGRVLAVACGHSSTHICQAGDFENSFRLQSEEKELTWTATLFKSSQGLRAVAGSSFGDVLSWTLLNPIQLKTAERHLLSRLDKGTPASDKLLPVHRLSAHDGPVMRLKISSDSQRMVTASVDRTVRVWEVEKSNCSACSGGCFFPVLVHYGHLARVWDVSFVSNRSVVSVGEDHSCRVWGEQSGKEIACYHGHAGRNIWSVAVSNGLLATGGEDGAVKVRPLTTALTKGPFRLPKYENPRKKGAYNESGRTIVILDENNLLVTTDFGRILQGCIGECIEWTEIFRDDRGTAFTPCALVVCAGLIFAGQTDGIVISLREGRKVAALESEGMVMGLFAEDGPGGCDVLIASANGVLTHWFIGDKLHLCTKYRMKRTVKSSLVTAACINRDAGLVVTGDRGGRVLAYPLCSRASNSEMTHPVAIIRPHSDRVSSLHYNDRTKTVYTSGFDGAVVELDAPNQNTLEIRTVSRAPDRTDTITNYECGRILAFRGAEAVIWDIHSRTEVLRADVGNWRRAHDMYIKGNTVCYWRGGSIYITSGAGGGWGMTGGHGGRICGIDFVDSGLVTAGEDGVCIWRDGVVVQRLGGHTSCVNCVACRDDIMVTVGGKDEVFVWEEIEGMWRKRWGGVIDELLHGRSDEGRPMERALCVAFTESGFLVGRSDGSVVKLVDSVAKVVMKVSGGVLCIDCFEGGAFLGDTRGFVTILEGDANGVESLKVHEGGVNAIKTLENGWVSAGDDGAVYAYKKCGNGAWRQIWGGTLHTAAATGVTVSEKAVYSVGADQRMVIWRSDKTTVRKTSVVDASGIAYNRPHLVVGGVGLQFVDIS